MCMHPNAILLLVLTPEELSRKTMRAILSEMHVKENENITIEGVIYHHVVMEGVYEEGWQLTSKEGDLLFFDLVTYGFGEYISWKELEKYKVSLESWAKDICERYHCKYEIRVTANYW